MARALIVGCGCRGRMLGAQLRTDGWQVRGTTRDEEAAAAIAEVGLEAAIADPAVVGTVYDQLDGVTVVYWLLASAVGPVDAVEGLHGPRLERLLEKLVDTPVRGFVYEAEGSVDGELLTRGAALVRESGERWRIPVEVVGADPASPRAWCAAMRDAAERLAGPGA